MSSMVTLIIAAGRNWTIVYNAAEACDVVIKVFTCIKIAWDRVRSMFATLLTTITTIWRAGFKVWTVIFDNQFITGWLIAGTRLLKTLSGHSFRVKKSLQTNILVISYCKLP